MRVWTIRPPQVEARPEGKPKGCPRCGSRYLHRHGSLPKPVKDHAIKRAVVHRYRCARCRRTFRHYPEGIGRPDQGQRLIVLAAVAWPLGSSASAIAGLFAKCDAGIGKSTALRDGRAVADQLRAGLRRSGVVVPALGLDGTGIEIEGQAWGMVVAVGLGTGQPICIARVSELEGLLGWLEPPVKAYGVEVIVTDELPSHHRVAEAFGLEHAHCRFHLERRVGRLMRAFERGLGDGLQPLLAEVRQTIGGLPQMGAKRYRASLSGSMPASPPARRFRAPSIG